MEDKKIVQEYVNNFRRHLASHLRPGIGLSCKIFPAKAEGAVLEFTIGPSISNDDCFEIPKDTVNSILQDVPQRLIGGNIGGVKFGGTNVSMEPNRIVLIKGEDDPQLWNDQGARDDIERIIGTQMRAQK
ncbi:MAG: hypothetical protein P4L42_15530 [Desulfocapsaceae bacterium]|nr:hypothetical protein [Desulfocapsaceae bacterium]